MKTSLNSAQKPTLYYFIALISGGVVLVGYFIRLPVLWQLRTWFLQWFTFLAATALIVGLVNLASIHLKKIIHWTPKGVNSLLLLISMLAIMLLGFWFPPTHLVFGWIYQSILAPVEMSLLAILTITLIYILARLPFRKQNTLTMVFMITVIVILAGTIPFSQREFAILGVIKTWLEQILAVGGVRGLLIGIALGTIVSGLRVLLGGERPFEA